MSRRNQITFAIVLLVCLGGCHSTEEQTRKEEVVNEQVYRKLPPTDSIHTSTVPEELLKADLFGEFFNDRVSFYTNENPNVEIEGVDVTSAIYYYIDDELFQTKYHLARDITSPLIKSNGKFKIRGLNNRNSYFIKRLRHRILYGSQIVSLINYYQLRWDLDDQEIIYQVRRDTVEQFYTYIERAKGYQQIFRQIESTES